jgi:hypothetical protein
MKKKQYRRFLVQGRKINGISKKPMWMDFRPDPFSKRKTMNEEQKTQQNEQEQERKQRQMEQKNLEQQQEQERKQRQQEQLKLEKQLEEKRKERKQKQQKQEEQLKRKEPKRTIAPLPRRGTQQKEPLLKTGRNHPSFEENVKERLKRSFVL